MFLSLYFLFLIKRYDIASIPVIAAIASNPPVVGIGVVLDGGVVVEETVDVGVGENRGDFVGVGESDGDNVEDGITTLVGSSLITVKCNFPSSIPPSML